MALGRESKTAKSKIGDSRRPPFGNCDVISNSCDVIDP